MSKITSLDEVLKVPDGPTRFGATRVSTVAHDIDLLRREFGAVGAYIIDVPGSWTRVCPGGLSVAIIDFYRGEALWACPKNGCAQCNFGICTAGAAMAARFVQLLDEQDMLLGREGAE